MTGSFFTLITEILTAGTLGFGGGLGAVNALIEFAVDSGFIIDDAEIIRVTALAQYSGYSQGIMVSAYLGSFYGLLQAALCVLAYILPSVLIIAVFFKIGARLYKNQIFNYCLKYINLLSVGYMAVILMNYIFIVFAIDPIFFLAFAGIACYANIAFNISPALITAAGLLLGLIFRWGWKSG